LLATSFARGHRRRESKAAYPDLQSSFSMSGSGHKAPASIRCQHQGLLLADGKDLPVKGLGQGSLASSRGPYHRSRDDVRWSDQRVRPRRRAGSSAPGSWRSSREPTAGTKDLGCPPTSFGTLATAGSIGPLQRLDPGCDQQQLLRMCALNYLAESGILPPFATHRL
jgi:hypothetical protein